MKLGIIDLDTSHPKSWIPIQRQLGHEVVGVWDGGDVHPRGYAQAFADEQKIAKVYATLEEMIPEVDCVVVQGCNWDTHLEKARPFIEAGKAVLMDKPLMGKVRDLRQIEVWARQGKRITGGSSLRFSNEVCAWLEIPVTERGTPHTVFCGCGVDEFNYAIHAFSMVSGLMGPGIESARHLSKGLQRRIELRWKDGRTAFLIIGKSDKYLPFYATVLTENGVTHIQADISKIYRALLEKVLPFLAGESERAPVPMHELIEPELALIAARRSWLEEDRKVLLSKLLPEDGFDGAAFAVEYRKSRYK